jgi:hypothetical protein
MNAMSDQEKSVLLAKAMGQSIKMELIANSDRYRITLSKPVDHTWIVDRHLLMPWEDIPHAEREKIINDPAVLRDCLAANIPNLYHPTTMALAWRVLNWAWEHFEPYGAWTNIMFEAFYDAEIAPLWPTLAPADAQRAWLDKILSLVIEAGLIEVTR